MLESTARRIEVKVKIKVVNYLKNHNGAIQFDICYHLWKTNL